MSRKVMPIFIRITQVNEAQLKPIFQFDLLKNIFQRYKIYKALHCQKLLEFFSHNKRIDSK